MGKLHDLVKVHGKEVAKSLVPDQSRSLIDLAAEMMDSGDGAISYLYSGFAMLSFPYRELKQVDAVWERRNGSYTMIVEPGVVPTASGTKKYGVPYGSRARIIMCFLQTEAVKNQSRVVTLGSSMTQWMERMGIAGRGGWNIKAIRDQTMRISACRLTVGFQTGAGENGFIHRNVVSGMINLPDASERKQGWLLEETAELSEDFYQQLRDHPLPVEEQAIRLISNSAMTIDIYVWLAYRLYTLAKPTTIHRDALHAQFGSMYALPRQFWAHFQKSLLEALAVYPQANVEIMKDGLKLLPSASPVPRKMTHGLTLIRGEK